MWLDGEKLLGKVNFQTVTRKLKSKTKLYRLKYNVQSPIHK